MESGKDYGDEDETDFQINEAEELSLRASYNSVEDTYDQNIETEDEDRYEDTQKTNCNVSSSENSPEVTSIAKNISSPLPNLGRKIGVKCSINPSYIAASVTAVQEAELNGMKLGAKKTEATSNNKRDFSSTFMEVEGNEYVREEVSMGKRAMKRN
jgi:ATP-dependent Zn protease